MTTPRSRGDELIGHILTKGDANGKVSNELIGEFYSHGYPVERLIPLLRSDDSAAVRAGAFLVEELGAKAAPLLRELPPLLECTDTWVKSGVLSAVLTSATDRDGEVVGPAVSLITDEHPVRKMAFELMARAGRPPLVAGVPYVTDPQIAALLEWVLEVEDESRDDDEIAARLREADGLAQVFAAIAAARVYRRNPHYLQLAASLSEGDAQSLAASELAWLGNLDEQAQRRSQRAQRGAG
jgi:hypothetical protein